MILAAALAEPTPRAVVWALALVWMGGACLANAWRCRRTHCHVSGPLYLLLAAVVLAHGLGWVDLGPAAWWWLGGLALFGILAVTMIAERLLGRYLG